MRARISVAAVCCIFSLVLLTSTSFANGLEGSLEEQVLKLQKLIEMQQEQLNRQAEELNMLKQQIGNNTQAIAKSEEEQKVEAEPDKTVTSSFPNVNLSLYGHINRAILYGDNGDDSQFYFVDNINSQTRMGLRANVETAHDWNVGGRIEYGIVSNGSSDVNQDNSDNATSVNFKLRWAEVSFANQRVGKFSLGKGSSATDGTAEVDLSGTTVAAYSAIADIAASFLWFDGTALSDIDVGNVNDNFDGLGRTDRLRYDTPTFGGFSVAGSISSGEGYDGALRFSRKFGETKVAAALGIADAGDLIPDVDLVYSGSASVLFPGGFNMTVAAGSEDVSNSAQDDPVSYYAKLGYRTKFYEASSTAFSIDYGRATDLYNDGDTAESIGLAAVHSIKDWGTEVYIVYRLYQLEATATDYDDIHAVMTGARVKF